MLKAFNRILPDGSAIVDAILAASSATVTSFFRAFDNGTTSVGFEGKSANGTVRHRWRNGGASNWNGADAAYYVARDSTSSRSINAAGTVNASGADYAEYEHNNGITIAKGSVVGFKADGTLTLTFSESVRFGVKSTNPSYVGGDGWGVGLEGDDLEAARKFVDRIAYSGKVPVNVVGANPGDYIVAVLSDGGLIGASPVQSPTFEQYKNAVGRVNRILEDGRAEIAIIIH
jgi:hypothetical protein